MRRRARWGGGGQGFALLAALLIAAIALLATASLLAVALSTTAISADDASSTRAADAARAGVADALERLRWGWLRADSAALPESFGSVAFAGGSYSVTIAPLSAADPSPRLDASSPISAADPAVAVCRIDATGVWGQARHVVHVTALSTPDGLPRGLVVGADATLQAATQLQGCGLYAGGEVRGREWVTLTNEVDLAYGGLYPRTGVHAAAGIFADGVEEHTVADAPAADSDADQGVPPPAGLVEAPTPAILGALASHASDPVAAVGPFGLDLAMLDRVAPGPLGEPSLPAGGRVYVVAAGSGTLNLFGARPGVPQACPVTVVVLGDCIAGAGPSGGAATALDGALVVTGTLTVSAPLEVQGGLYARRLVVCAPLTVGFSDSSDAATPGRANVRDVSWRG